MYDTIKFSLFTHDYPHISFFEDIPQHLTGITADGDGIHGRYIIGYSDTFKISINRNRIKVDGSGLGRYLNGNNQDGMTLQQTRHAIEKLSDALHLDFNNAKVTRVDVGKNIITKFKPEIYFPYFGESVGYKRLEAGSGLYYKNSLRTLVFYNKIKEQKAKRQTIQAPFLGNNLLRYELRFDRQLKRELSMKEITAKSLYDENFYITIARMWRDQYLKIIKRSNKEICIPTTSSTRDLMASLAAVTIKEMGDENIMRMITEWKDKGLITKKQASDHRKFIRDSLKREMNCAGNEFIEELDKKIKQSIRLFI